MSKFKINTKSLQPEDIPSSIEEFGAGSAVAKTQSGGRPPKPIRLNLDIDPALHRRIKNAAFAADEKIAVLVRKWIEFGLEQQK